MDNLEKAIDIESFNLSYNLESAEKDFEDMFNLKYRMGSVQYLRSKSLSFTQLLNYDDYNTIHFIAAGLYEDKTPDKKALELLDKWIDKGYTLRIAHALALGKARSFFVQAEETLLQMELIKREQDPMMLLVLKALNPITNQMEWYLDPKSGKS